MNALSFASANPIIKDYSARYSEKAELIRNVFATIVAVITGIAVICFSIYQFIHLPKQPTGIYEFKNGAWKEIHQSDGTKMALLVACGMYIAPLALGGLTGTCLNQLIDRIFLRTHYASIQKLYEYNNLLDPISNDKIPPMLTAVDEDAKVRLIALMNFSQLNEARKFLGDQKFVKYIKNVESYDHSLWRQIIELKKRIRTPKEFKLALNSPQFQAVTRNHSGFWFGLYQVFGTDPEYRAVLIKHMFSRIKTKQESDAITVVEVGNKKRCYNTSLLKANSTFFSAMLGNFLEGQSGRVTFEEDYFHILDLLAGNCTISSPQEIVDILPQVPYFQAEVLINPIEEMLMLDIFELDMETRIEIASNHSYLQKFRAQLEGYLLKDGVSDENWDLLVEQSNCLQSEKMRTEMRQAAKIEILLSPNDGLKWLKRALFCCHSTESRTEVVNSLSVDEKDFRTFYEMGCYLRDELNVDLVHKTALGFCKLNAQSIRSLHFWKIKETPADILAILYPSS